MASSTSKPRPSSDNGFGLEQLDLILPDLDKPKPERRSRLLSVSAALAIFVKLRDADRTRAANRSNIDGMFDGLPPYDQGLLAATGQGSRTNLNMGEAQRHLDVAMSAFVDLYASLERLVRIRCRIPDASRRMTAEDVLSTELTRLIRSVPEAFPLYLRLCTEFTKHGVAVGFFDSPRDWMYRVCGLSEFLVPQQATASEDGVEVACSRRLYMLHELFAHIREPETAAKLGWNVDEVRRVMTDCATSSGPTHERVSDWEGLQRELKNNDLYSGVRNTTVAIVHQWVRELDGSMTLCLFAEDNPRDFLYRGEFLYPSPDRAFVLFTYGVGTNGTLHSVRGLGHRIFNHIQTSNRLRCQMIDSAMLGGSVMIQPESERALQKLSFQMFGPYSILSPDAKVIEKAVPNLSNAMTPAVQMIEEQLALNVDNSSTYGVRSSPYRNELQVEHDLSVASRLTGSTLNLFYAAWSRLLREVVRRVIERALDPLNKDPRLADFVRRCAERGVTPDVLRTVDTASTIAVRAIGAGSAANRLMALRELNNLSGSFDDVGRRNLIRDMVAERVGVDLAERYAPADPEPRMTSDAKIADLENDALMSGRAVEVLDGEMHGQHMRRHAPVLAETLGQIQEGLVDPVDTITSVMNLYDHVAAHMGYLARDPAAQAEVAGYRQLMQIAEEVITNTSRKIQAERRRMREAGMDPESGTQQPQEDPARAEALQKLEMRVQEHQVRMDIFRRKAEQEMLIKQAKADQELALKDAERAAVILRGNSPNPTGPRPGGR